MHHVATWFWKHEAFATIGVGPMNESQDQAASAAHADEPTLRHVREALHELRFGTVTLIVQDGVVIQIDRTEKRRLARRP